MTDSHRPYDAPQPAAIDDMEDRMGQVRELDFDDTDGPTGRIGDTIPADELEHLVPDERAREAGLTGASMDDHNPTDDDMSPETLIREDGARSPDEPGDSGPADQELSFVDEDDIGGGDGLDEEELALIDPLDGKR
ncbi:serine kinase/phosphatase [Pseudomonas sp. CFBP 8758]|uniref:serine kinase/phosphatase n=1 Tax=Pseudomonas sp. CFBP 8758 TaxID=2775286 RepID=UPI001785C20A|nr:serine kinase/phosphatase [Pseudomonas sp. CFBP 8758]MBD8592536.1 serine kinase/phosphatase [Pseudomonas sp. CFBP 8758]